LIIILSLGTINYQSALPTFLLYLWRVGTGGLLGFVSSQIIGGNNEKRHPFIKTWRSRRTELQLQKLTGTWSQFLIMILYLGTINYQSALPTFLL